MRFCSACRQTDDHPRHVFADRAPIHMDCCGCPACVKQLAEAGDKKGDELRTHLLALPQDAVHDHTSEG